MPDPKTPKKGASEDEERRARPAEDEAQAYEAAAEEDLEGDDLEDRDLEDGDFEDEDFEDEDGEHLPPLTPMPVASPSVAPDDMHCGYVALIGAPNAGKSTLLNQLVGSKVSIVTHKVQTTRALVRGIVIEGAAQIVFVDTPGIFKPKRRLDRAMVTTAWNGALDADFVGVLIDAKRGLDDEALKVLEKLADVRRPAFLILNKIDLVKRETLLALAAEANEKCAFTHTFMVSAQTGSGVADLRRWLGERMPKGPWLYPEDQLSDLPMRMLAAEITREKLYLRLHEELPYASTVETEMWKIQPDGSVRVEQTIYVERESQKKIVLGKAGATIKAISMAARKEIADIAETKVHLFLFVKVRENWSDDPERYREMGLEFPKG